MQTIGELSVHELKALLEGGEAPLVLDVREAWELGICALAGAVHIPMREIPARLRELPAEQRIVVLCHHGARSRQVAPFLAARGYASVCNLRGGINAWAREIDPHMATY